jgi:hypothetical protein
LISSLTRTISQGRWAFFEWFLRSPSSIRQTDFRSQIYFIDYDKSPAICVVQCQHGWFAWLKKSGKRNNHVRRRQQGQQLR